MVEKDYMLYGPKILNIKTQEIGLLICLWKNKFSDKTIEKDLLSLNPSTDTDNKDQLESTLYEGKVMYYS